MEATAKTNSSPSGALDLGSNSFRLLIGRVAGKDIQTLVKHLHTVRLGGNLKDSGTISDDSLQTGMRTIRDFKVLLDRYGVSKVTCCGTESLRRAANSSDFLIPAESILDCKINILSGSREAELSTIGVLAGLRGAIPFPSLIVDVGGGSTELSYLAGSQGSQENISMPAGAIALSENNPTYEASVYELIRDHVKSFIAQNHIGKDISLVGTGGTATTIAMLNLHLEKYNAGQVHGHRIQKKDLDELQMQLAGLSAVERNRLPGLEHGRGEIIVAGCKIYQEIIATIGVECMIVSDWGLLEGIFLYGNTL